MSYSNSTLSSYSLVQELANNTRVIAPPASTATQDANATGRVLQGIGTRDLSAMALGTSLTVNSDTLQQLQLRNSVATTFTGGNIVRFSNAAWTNEVPDTATGAAPTGADAGGPTPLGEMTAYATPWEADWTKSGVFPVTGLPFQNSTWPNRNIWGNTSATSFPFYVDINNPAVTTYRVKTENPSDGIDYVNVSRGTAAAGGGATTDTITVGQLATGGHLTLPVAGGADAYLGRNILGMTFTAAPGTVIYVLFNGILGPISNAITVDGDGAPVPVNVAPSGFYVRSSNIADIQLGYAEGDLRIMVAGPAVTEIVLTMGARFAVSDADGNDAVPSLPLDAGSIVFLKDQDATAHYLDFGRDTALNAQRLHDAIFGNSHGRTESKSQLLSLSELVVNPGVDLFVGTSTADPITEVISPAAVDSAGVHVVFLTDLGQASAASDGSGGGRNANVQVIDNQANTNFEVKLLAQWLADGSTTAGETAGTFPRMQFTRFQDGMASPTN